MARRTLSRFGSTETMASQPGQWAIIQLYYAIVWLAFVIYFLFVGSNPLVAAYNMIVWLPQKQSKNVPASRLASCLLWTRGGPWSL
jgi:hypothetical protein